MIWYLLYLFDFEGFTESIEFPIVTKADFLSKWNSRIAADYFCEINTKNSLSQRAIVHSS